MQSLDAFRQSWQQEISKDKPTTHDNDIPHTPIGDLCRLGAKSKRSLDCETSIPPPSQSTSFSGSVNNSASFTIGIRSFVVSNTATAPSTVAQPSTSEVATKKLKAMPATLLEELIRDIDESTDIPFFNISLPREIALKIFDYLSIEDLYSCLRVCKAWHSLSSDELLWYNLFKRLKLDQPKQQAPTENWKETVKLAIMSDQQLIQNFRNHQCRTTKLTYRVGVVLTCANNDSSTIVAGYSTGIIRTWPIQSILDLAEETEENEQCDTPDIIYESSDSGPEIGLTGVKSVGLLKNDIFAVHANGLLEVWTKEAGQQPRYTQDVTTSVLEHVVNDDYSLCTASRSKFYVWNFYPNESVPHFQELNFNSEFNDRILSFCMSSSHSVPISIVAAARSLWCLSLSDISHRYAFYSILESDHVQKISLDIHHEEPLAVVGLGSQIKLFDLQNGRCNILSNHYASLPAQVHLVRANQCPNNEFLVAFDNYQISIFDRRQPNGAIQHFYGHHAPITTLQVDSWKLASTDRYGFVRLW